jgi:hypothetical protein
MTYRSCGVATQKKKFDAKDVYLMMMYCFEGYRGHVNIYFVCMCTPVPDACGANVLKMKCAFSGILSPHTPL